MSIKCEICKINVYQSDINSHNVSNKHIKNLKNKKENDRECKKFFDDCIDSDDYDEFLEDTKKKRIRRKKMEKNTNWRNT